MELIQYLKESDEGVFIDRNFEIYNFLKEQYNYEINRVPIHQAFKNNYKFNYFDASEMLNYYINPLGKETKYRYYFDNYSNIYPLIYKRIIDNDNMKQII